jgi:deazaflavin-dependent oxidoreductase (nitroreductase family)
MAAGGPEPSSSARARCEHDDPDAEQAHPSADHVIAIGLEPVVRVEPRRAAMPDDDFCYLTTTGRSSGKPHRIEIWYAADGDTLFLLAGGRQESDWVKNLIASPDVTVEVGEVTHHATGRVIEGTDLEDRARTLVFDKYQPRMGGSDLTGWRASALPIALDLEPG